MPENRHDTERTSGRKPVPSHGAFKHTAKGATLKDVIGAYGLNHSDLKRVRGLVAGKGTAHAR